MNVAVCFITTNNPCEHEGIYYSQNLKTKKFNSPETDLGAINIFRLPERFLWSVLKCPKSSHFAKRFDSTDHDNLCRNDYRNVEFPCCMHCLEGSMTVAFYFRGILWSLVVLFHNRWLFRRNTNTALGLKYSKRISRNFPSRMAHRCRNIQTVNSSAMLEYCVKSNQNSCTVSCTQSIELLSLEFHSHWPWYIIVFSDPQTMPSACVMSVNPVIAAAICKINIKERNNPYCELDKHFSSSGRLSLSYVDNKSITYEVRHHCAFFNGRCYSKYGQRHQEDSCSYP